MKILSIQNQLNSQTFKGLCASVSSEGIAYGDNLKYFEEHHYFPFKDETKEKIDAYIKPASASYYNTGMEINRSIKVKDVLPFTEKEFVAYKMKHAKGVPMGETELMIDKYLYERYDLRKYMNVIPKESKPPKFQKTATILNKIIKSISKLLKK